MSSTSIFSLVDSIGNISFEIRSPTGNKPNKSDDSSRKYSTNSVILWNGVLYSCKSPSVSTAVWEEVSGGATPVRVKNIVDEFTPTRGFPVALSGTSETVVCSVPCEVVWVSHDSTAGATITLRDAGTLSTGITATQTISMDTAGVLSAGTLRAQYGLTAQLSAGTAVIWVSPLNG